MSKDLRHVAKKVTFTSELIERGIGELPLTEYYAHAVVTDHLRRFEFALSTEDTTRIMQIVSDAAQREFERMAGTATEGRVSR